MNTTDLQQRIEVMQSFLQGKAIQWYDESNRIWRPCDVPSWKPEIKYRVVPENCYRPFKNTEEFLPHVDRWVKQKAFPEIYRVVSVTPYGIGILGNGVVRWSDLFVDWEFVKGKDIEDTICGMLEAQEET